MSNISKNILFILFGLVFILAACERDENFLQKNVSFSSQLKLSNGSKTGSVSYRRSEVTLKADLKASAPWVLTITGNTSKHIQEIEGHSDHIEYTWDGMVDNVLQLDDETFTAILSFPDAEEAEASDTVEIYVSGTPNAENLGNDLLTFDDQTVTLTSPNSRTVNGIVFPNYNIQASNDQFMAFTQMRHHGYSSFYTVWDNLTTEISTEYGGKAFALSCNKSIAYSNVPANFANRRAINTMYRSPWAGAMQFYFANTTNTLDMTGLTFDNMYINFYLYSDKANKYTFSVIYNDRDDSGAIKYALSLGGRNVDWTGWRLVSFKLSSYVWTNAISGGGDPAEGIIEFNMADTPARIFMNYGLTVPYARNRNNFDATFRLVVDNFILTKDMPLDEILDNLYL